MERGGNEIADHELRQVGEDVDRLVQQFLADYNLGQERKYGEDIEEIRQWIGESAERRRMLLENIAFDAKNRPRSWENAKDQKGLRLLEKLLSEA